MRRRILQVIPTLDQAGAEKQMSLLARGLPREEFDVHVCALTRGGPLLVGLVDDGIPVKVIGKRWRADPQAYWQLRRYVARLQPVVIHTWMFAANAYGYAAARAVGIRCQVAAQRCVDPWKGRVQLAVDRHVARHCRRVVVNGAGVRDFYVHHRLPAEKICVIPNGVPAAEPSKIDRQEFLDELDLPAGSRLVGLIGRLWPQKRVKDAIWMADLLKCIRDDVHLLIIGDGPLYNRLRRYRDELSLADRVHFLGHRSDVPHLMPHLDVLWSTSGYEGQSNAILEAMASGLPVVATDVPGNRELVLSEKTGYLVPLAERARFVHLTDTLLDDAELAARLGRAGRERVLREFSVERMIERHVELYRELLG